MSVREVTSPDAGITVDRQMATFRTSRNRTRTASTRTASTRTASTRTASTRTASTSATMVSALRKLALASAACSALALTLSACGSSSGSSTTTTGPMYEVTTGKVSGLGTVLVDGQGFTVYLYEPDAQSGKSRCSGPCAVEWTPLTLSSGATEPKAGSGIDASKLSTFKRSDGSIQVTYNGWPLYTWAEDAAPGQATGEGLNNLGGLWFVLNPAGNAIKKIGAGSI
jgi:predicted lipoprotein with Yx(FWY)xxD motif